MLFLNSWAHDLDPRPGFSSENIAIKNICKKALLDMFVKNVSTHLNHFCKAPR